MIISILSADIKWGIGKKNGLLFHLPKDMQFFKETTMGHTVAMGENTLLSFPNSKPLKNRTNIVLSKDETHNYEGVINIHDYNQFIDKIKEIGQKEDIYIIGGASIYNQTLPIVDFVLLTKVYKDGGAEVFFNNLDENKDFKLIKQSEKILDGDIEISFCVYQNINKK